MNNNDNQIKNPIVIKGDIFSDYLNCNSFHNSLMNKDFAKPDNETFDKFFNSDENSIKSYNSLNDFNKPYFSKPSISDGQISNIFSIKNSEFENGSKEKYNNDEITHSKDFIKRNIFETLKNKEITAEEKKQKKLIMNRESAKKSRLKKKNYIKNLEKQYMLLKEEFIKIREEQKLKNKSNLNSQILSSENQYIIKNNKKDFGINMANKTNKFKFYEKNNISNNANSLENDNTQNDNVNNQKRLMIYLLINQIDIMTPIKIKSFQNKFLKMKKLEADDNIEVIKNKINMNLNIIIELYGIEIENKSFQNLNLNINKKSIAYQLYDYYKDVKLLVNKFENIYNNLENI